MGHGPGHVGDSGAWQTAVARDVSLSRVRMFRL
jgi:hypothetical protein